MAAVLSADVLAVFRGGVSFGDVSLGGVAVSVGEIATGEGFFFLSDLRLIFFAGGSRSRSCWFCCLFSVLVGVFSVVGIIRLSVGVVGRMILTVSPPAMVQCRTVLLSVLEAVVMVAVDVVVVLASVTWKPAVARMVAAIPIAALDMNLGFGNEEDGTVVIGTAAAGTCCSPSATIRVAPLSSESSRDVDGISESENLLSVWLRVTGGVWSRLEPVLPVFPPLLE